MNDIQLAVPAWWISFMTRTVYSHTTLNAIQYYISLSIKRSWKNMVKVILADSSRTFRHHPFCKSVSPLLLLAYLEQPLLKCIDWISLWETPRFHLMLVYNEVADAVLFGTFLWTEFVNYLYNIHFAGLKYILVGRGYIIKIIVIVFTGIMYIWRKFRPYVIQRYHWIYLKYLEGL